ncbi:hypothetical protein N480_23755 [Pseudoalteromonas luteoviolacea S2607]|uniref:hypothetical protein n=1 Tax=Pseudoalteromonas luteoviolacea TaxID=43657 RepID=UPI0007B09824|nr:hypothetical protein [Pseudoalteromonas luteoviolacea]KZN33541.1 hypothetical protein N480_23755 [Pseudoalteromonas luteoviolacea S2607]
MKTLSIAALLLSTLTISVQALATDYTITKQKQPSRMLVLSSAGGLSSELFSVLNMDLRDIPYRDKTGTITGISYVSASFSDSATETAELCFYRAYSSNPLMCEEIVPNSSGMVTAFNGQWFRAGVQASIVHRVEATGSFHYLEPNREESVTFHYTTN